MGTIPIIPPTKNGDWGAGKHGIVLTSTINRNHRIRVGLQAHHLPRPYGRDLLAFHGDLQRAMASSSQHVMGIHT